MGTRDRIRSDHLGRRQAAQTAEICPDCGRHDSSQTVCNKIGTPDQHTGRVQQFIGQPLLDFTHAQGHHDPNSTQPLDLNSSIVWFFKAASYAKTSRGKEPPHARRLFEKFTNFGVATTVELPSFSFVLV